jgi:putative ABC transport system permease protein
MVFKQIWFMQKQDLGVRLNQIMVSYSPMTMIKKPSREIKLKTFQDEVMRSPGVVSFTTAETIPGKSFKRTTNDVHLDNAEENKYLFSLANIDQNYFDFFSIKMLAGSNFLSSSDYDGNKVIVNAMACQRLGIPDNQAAIDRTININDQPYQIIGVVDDYHHLSLKDEIAPAIFFKSQHWHLDVGFYCVKVLPVNIKSTISEVNKTWDSLYPDEPYLFSFLDDTFNALYNEDKKFGSSYMLFSLIAIFIAGMGLFALAKISAESKIKEIGIRKVNGASIVKIMTMLNKSYLKWVTIAFVIACPVAWYVLHKWLQNFAVKTTLSWWIFVAAGLITLGIALITVSWQSWHAATRNPVEALRYE